MKQKYKFKDFIKSTFFSAFMIVAFEFFIISMSLIYATFQDVEFLNSQYIELVISMFIMVASYLMVFFVYEKRIHNFNIIKVESKTNLIYHVHTLFTGFMLSYLTMAFFTLFDEIPISEEEILFEQIAMDYPWYAIISALFIAPIFEELFFRKYMLTHLLVKMKPAYAIIISALLFGAFHMNIRQFLLASMVGLVAGYVYYKTRDIKNSMFLHFSYNLASFIPFLTEEHLDIKVFFVAFIIIGRYLTVNKDITCN